MTELIEPTKKMRVLEIGTGSGYQAAVLAECVGEVDTIEVVPAWARRPRACSASWAIATSGSRIGDGYEGWPERAPYDAIILTAAPPTDVPRPLLDSSSRAAGSWPRSAVVNRTWSGSPRRRQGTSARSSRPSGSCP